MLTKRRLLSSTLVLVFLLAASLAGAREEKGNPVGEVTIKTTRVSVGIGYTWGDGTLRFKGKKYKFKVHGLNMIGLGVASMTARGDVYNLESLDDFPGKYFGVEGGATMIKGSAGLVIKNSQGVVMNLKADRAGVDLRLGDEGLSITEAWK
jgi:hypothetical protein